MSFRSVFQVTSFAWFELDMVSHTDAHPIVLGSRVFVCGDGCVALKLISCRV
jgi:hypothetical protein